MKICCMMMFKNEDDLLEIWARYHGGLFGIQNLYLFDNGSTSEHTLEVAAMLESEGAHVDRSYAGAENFTAKGDIFASLIQRMDATDPADFYFPLDCDEFLGVTTASGEILFRAAAIEAELLRFVDYAGVLSIRLAYQNIPGSAGQFRPAFGALPKVFFARDACRALEHGFHQGLASIEALDVETSIVHAHYHHKPLPLLKEHALEKLRAVTQDFSDEALAARVAAREPGWHLIDYLQLRDDEDYVARFRDGITCRLPDLERAFDDIGMKPPFGSSDRASAPRSPTDEGSQPVFQQAARVAVDTTSCFSPDARTPENVVQPTNELDRLAVTYGSDKFGSHWYTRHYHDAFQAIRDRPIQLLEIGIGGYDNPNDGGASLRMWRDYFPNGQIHGLDFYDKSGIDADRIKTYLGSQADPSALAGVIAASPSRSFDIIIDDGSHRCEHIIATFMMMFQYVSADGWYVIEDTQTSYWPDYGGSYTGFNLETTTIGFFRSLIDGVNWQEIHRPNYVPTYFDQNILSIQFLHNMIFIRKGANTASSNVLRGNRLPHA